MRRLLIVCLFVASACGGNPSPNPPTPPSDFQLSIVVRDTTGAFVQKATIAIDSTRLTTNDFGFAETRVARGGHTITVQAEGYKEPTPIAVTVDRHLHRDVVVERARPPTSRIRADGRVFVNDAGIYRGRWASGLTLLVRSKEERTAFLEWATRTGFDGVRVFAGALPWAGQTPGGALAVLPDLVGETAARGLYLYVVAITESGTGYDVESHLRQVAEQCAAAVHCVLEVANEIQHPTQSATVNDPRRLENIAARVIPSGVPWALGAMLGQDEPDANGYPPNGVASFNTSHLDRSRQGFEQIRRVREIAAISELTGKPAVSGEPIGANEVSQPGRRESDPSFFFAYGALCRLFELGACVFHSEDGLNARILGPVQQQCAEAFLDGYRSIDSEARLSYRNANWAGADVPVASFTGAVRVYAGITGNDGYVVVVGDTGVQVQWKNGYHVVAEQARRPGVIVWKISR